MGEKEISFFKVFDEYSYIFFFVENFISGFKGNYDICNFFGNFGEY